MSNRSGQRPQLSSDIFARGGGFSSLTFLSLSQPSSTLSSTTNNSLPPFPLEQQSLLLHFGAVAVAISGKG